MKKQKTLTAWITEQTVIHTQTDSQIRIHLKTDLL